MFKRKKLYTDTYTLRHLDYTLGYGKDCTWWLQAPSGKRIQLNPFSYRTKNGYDFLRIYDGRSSSSREIAKLSGTGTRSKIESSGNALFLRFTQKMATFPSHHIIRGDDSGFQIYYQLIDQQEGSTGGNDEEGPAVSFEEAQEGSSKDASSVIVGVTWGIPGAILLLAGVIWIYLKYQRQQKTPKDPEVLTGEDLEDQCLTATPRPTSSPEETTTSHIE